VFLVKCNILVLSAGDYVSYSYKIFLHILPAILVIASFLSFIFIPHRFSDSVARHPETFTSSVGLYSADLTNQCVWGSVSDLHARVMFRDIKKLKTTGLIN